jgi:N,N'-diacetyllegionaminate synthase
MNVKLGGKKLNYSKVHIVLEAGPTHTGIKSAKKLVDLAKKAGADSVKFQMVDTDRLMATGQNVDFEYSYLEKDENGKEIFKKFSEPLSDILKRRSLSKMEWLELKKYCDEKGIHFFTTASYNDEVDFMVDELKMDSIKIASSDVKQIDFIKYCARKGVNIQLDTGNSDIWEIEQAVIAIEEEGNENIIIHHCPSGYPARLESINLKMIKTLKDLFPNYLIAFSDHTQGWEMDIAAVSLGAGMIEKTITENRFTKSCEHSFSLEMEDSVKFVQSIRQLEVALGSSRRVFPKEVKSGRSKTRRSPYSLKKINKGDKLRVQDFEFKRPGFGLSHDEFKFFIGKTINTDLNNGDILTVDHLL